LPLAAGMQLILWHDTANGRIVRWAIPMKGQKGGVDIAAQMKQSLSHADEDYGEN
jgi:hypothetical protein